jgi:aryl-alcohol dehydrogenase-like predicted oxidoreductase
MAMRYRLLGSTGLRVSELCLGAMTFGEDWGWGASAEDSRKLFERFVEAGGNFIDTANHYTNGTSERIVGELVRRERERFVVATKYTLTRRPNDPNGGGNHRKSLVQSLEGSLRRLGLEYVDLYWVHVWDRLTPIEETLRALDDVVRAGKVLHVGISDAPAWVVSRGNAIAELRGQSAFAAVQVPYSLIERSPERELLPMAEALGLAVTTWGVLGGGVLSGRFAGKERPAGTRLGDNEWGRAALTERNLAIAAEVDRVAREVERSSSQVALAWVRAQKRGNLIPILGARRLAQLEDNLGALTLTLSSDQLERLDAASRIERGFPLDLLDRVKTQVYGETLAAIDVTR